MIENKLDVFVLYSNSEGRECTFFDLLTEKSIMDEQDYESDNFWNCTGGIAIRLHGYCTILYSTDFHHLVQVTNFLIHSLYWLKGIKTNWFDEDDKYPNSILLRTESGSYLRINIFSEKDIELSFEKGDEMFEVRGKGYFNNIVIRKESWIKSAEEALEEYFKILTKITTLNPGNNFLHQLFKDYYNLYVEIK